MVEVGGQMKGLLKKDLPFCAGGDGNSDTTSSIVSGCNNSPSFLFVQINGDQ